MSVCLDALEISFDATPLPEKLPSNMRLHHWDTKTDVPEYLVGVYDIVNIRNFAFITQGAELEAVAHRLLRLLSTCCFCFLAFLPSNVVYLFGFMTCSEPGGYIQWTDIDVNSVRVGKIQPEGQTYLQTTLMEIFKGSDVRLRPAWVPTLLAAFTEAGFIEVTADIKLDVDVTVDIKVAPTYLAQALHECEMPAIEAVPRNISSIKGTRTTLKQTAGKAANETRDDLYLAFARYTIICRKELDTKSCRVLTCGTR